MISIRIDQLTKRFGSVTALDRVDLTIKPGELFFLLGPSGCGKTTLLRTIAGFYLPDEGRVWFGDEDVTRLPPHRRNTGMMFQSYALWPHMTVAENVAFGLEERHVPVADIKREVAAALATMHMTGYEKRRPNELSGGQQQRVALARALVVHPRCLLLDEPLSNLDAGLRLEMRAEIRRVTREFQLTTVYVTHDQKEALSIADRLAVLDRGRVIQVGTPREVYRRPRTAGVARFIGETDFIPGTLRTLVGERATVATDIGELHGLLGDPSQPLPIGAPVLASVRPEAWRLTDEPAGANCLQGTLGDTTYLGELAQQEFRAGDRTLRVLQLNPRDAADARRSAYATVQPEDVVVLAAG